MRQNEKRTDEMKQEEIIIKKRGWDKTRWNQMRRKQDETHGMIRRIKTWVHSKIRKEEWQAQSRKKYKKSDKTEKTKYRKSVVREMRSLHV